MTFKFFKMTIVSLFILSTYASANDQLTSVTFQFKKKEDRDLAARFSHLDILSQNTGKAIVNSYDLKMMKEKIPHLILEAKPLKTTAFKGGLSIKGEEEEIEFPRGDEKFHTYKEVTDLLKKYARDFPTITSLSSIGTTIQGRSMWALKLTNQKNLR
ncbi:MAG: M14 family zinc carboxypeptidase, partial [Bdellovibrionota bacterium]|nr:M14 family zinc carboxypeptidase [Bdellovibrionota bacterium]